jgi:16S rRNA (cytidine1402-2'-O)-methyltransferase
LPVRVVPGPSAVTSAVALAGFPSRGFVFGGFLPPKSGARRRRLAELDQPGLPIVLFESPHRLLKLLDDIEAQLGARRLYVGRELTKHFEENLLGTPGEVRAAFSARAVKGEVVLVVAPASRDAGDDGIPGGLVDLREGG